MERKKENAKKDFIDMIEKSWIDVRTEKALKGSYNHRWDILQIIYHSFLKGCGYTDFNWREKEKGGF